jgi:hypothetical protein
LVRPTRADRPVVGQWQVIDASNGDRFRLRTLSVVTLGDCDTLSGPVAGSRAPKQTAAQQPDPHTNQ